MKYFYRSAASPNTVMERVADFFGRRMSPTEEGSRRRRYASALGQLTVSVEAEGGHYTRITVETNQPGESELDRVAKRFLSVVHTVDDGHHALRGAY